MVPATRLTPQFDASWLPKVLAEAEAGHKANPDNHGRLMGDNNVKQVQGTSSVIYGEKTGTQRACGLPPQHDKPVAALRRLAYHPFVGKSQRVFRERDEDKLRVSADRP